MRIILLLLVIITTTLAVKLHDFKKCSQSGFCTRNRQLAQNPYRNSYAVDRNSLKFVQGQVLGELVSSQNSRLMFVISLIQEGIVRFQIDEKGGQRKRHQVQDVMIEEGFKLATYEQKLTDVELTIDFNQNKVAVQLDPFRVDYYADGVVVAQVNKNGLMNLEQSRSGPQEGEQWQETFGQHTDNVKYGPMSISLDVSFPGSQNVYGIPEHATSLSLKETNVHPEAKIQFQDEPEEDDDDIYETFDQPQVQQNSKGYSEPYRLYNLDVFEYDLDSPIALYGVVPLLWSHKKSKRSSNTVGFFWLNAAETWVDVKKTDDAASAHWMSETGVFDFSVLLGPTPKLVQKQYAQLTGSQVLPQLFSLAYHQCRWNYMDTKEVADVNAGFEEHKIPMDVIWLDIEHTNDKRYFTWHTEKFQNAKDMIQSIAEFGRKMITIIDPHIKRAEGYHVKDQASEKGMFVRNRDGGEYEGWCWPGSSSWIDYLSIEARIFWAKLFNYDAYQGSTESLFTWNDMNEPSVFNGPEITMPKDNLHDKDIEHRDVHNIYGMLLQRATYAGHVARSLPSGEVSHAMWTGRADLMHGAMPHRPFILSRAFFAGTQRYGAIWTGDNMAMWSHLQAAVPMLLSISLGGIGFCGCDVGGFFLNPNPELLTRWYQVGAFYPFFRAHAHLDTRRREPWVHGEPYTSIIRDSISIRYKMLPYWYTLFRVGQVDGITPMRPLLMEFPNDKNVYSEEDQFMVGEALMIKSQYKPLDAGGDKLSIYLPGSDIWFNWHTHIGYNSLDASKVNRVHMFQTPFEQQLPSLLRAGHTFPTRERMRRSSMLMAKDPLTLTIALDAKKQSVGEWYLDDGESFAYALKGEFVHKQIQTKLAASSLTFTTRDVVYEDTGKSKRMKPFQRPFLGEKGMTNDKGKVINWEDIERVMTLSPDVKYKENLDTTVKIERFIVLASSEHLEMRNLMAAVTEKSVKVTASVAGKVVQGIAGENLSIEIIEKSQMHGEEVAGSTEGVVSTYKLIVKKPPVGAGQDWDIKITW